MERFCSCEQKAVFGHADPAFGSVTSSFKLGVTDARFQSQTG